MQLSLSRLGQLTPVQAFRVGAGLDGPSSTATTWPRWHARAGAGVGLDWVAHDIRKFARMMVGHNG